VASITGPRRVVRHIIYPEFEGSFLPAYDAVSRPNENSFCAPLHLASANGNITAAELLIRHGAEIDMLNQNQETPLCLASHRGQKDIVDLLLDSGSDITHRDREGSTPLHRAAQTGHFDVVVSLLQRGADVNIRDSCGRTPLDLARCNWRFKVASLLEEHTEGMCSQGLTNSTPLKQASHGPPSRRSAAVTQRRRWQYRH
jgi:ankyrin repeat protein